MQSRVRFVTKRNGDLAPIDFNKITLRIAKLCEEFNLEEADPILIAQLTIGRVTDKISTTQLDLISSKLAAQHLTQHPEYGYLGAYIFISNLQKNTDPSFYRTMETVNQLTSSADPDSAPQISNDFLSYVKRHQDDIQREIDFGKDYLFDFFGIKTMERLYLKKVNNKVYERPQHLHMRVALTVTRKPGRDETENLKYAFETYRALSSKYYTHASPTIFNSGGSRQQLASCFLLGVHDSAIGIMDCGKNSALISKNGGGIGIHWHDIRGKGSRIRGTNGDSNGIIPFIKIFNDVSRAFNQGGKRKGSFAIYLEMHHCDIIDFLDLRKPRGDENLRARDIFMALWVSDLFMERMLNDEMWSLMCPDECPGLSDCYGEEYKALYEKYESEKRYKKQIKATHLWEIVLEKMLETGMPYVAYKDHVNRKTNQKNIGVIKSSNLCCEIMEYSDENEYAVCNLASISLPEFITYGKYDFDKLYRISRLVTRNLNNVIDINYYPVEETRRSNLKHRPIGIGIQGLADAYIKMGYPFDSPEAFQLNKDIMETIYFGAVTESCQLAKEEGPYATFEGSPISQGIFQFDMWGAKPNPTLGHDWESLRKQVMECGVRNSLLTALMPTASTSQFLGNNECFEPITSNIFTRETLAGEFVVLNEYLVRDLIKEGLWSTEMKEKIEIYKGSIQPIPEIPQKLKDLYKTVWEIKKKVIIDQSADRGAFVDQSQSMNLYHEVPNTKIIHSCLVHGWKRGLKTASYYTRTKGASDAIQFSINPDTVKKVQAEKEKNQTSSGIPKMKDDDCVMCGS